MRSMLGIVYMNGLAALIDYHAWKPNPDQNADLGSFVNRVGKYYMKFHHKMHDWVACVQLIYSNLNNKEKGRFDPQHIK